MNRGRVGVRVSLLVIILIAAMQVVPYGRDHTNPPKTGTPSWDSPQTEEYARRACYDCHSNETRWPWYASIAPVSWRIQHHVDEGREKLNFSEFDKPQREAHEAAEEVAKSGMPPRDYRMMHAESRLAPEQREAFIRGLEATFGSQGSEEADPEGEKEPDGDERGNAQ